MKIIRASVSIIAILILFIAISAVDCSGPTYFRIAVDSIQLVEIGKSKLHLDTLYYTYPKKYTGIDSTIYYEFHETQIVDTLHRYGILRTPSIEFYHTSTSNSAFAATEAGVMGSEQEILSIKLILIDNLTGGQTDISNVIQTSDSLFYYKWETQKYSDECHLALPYVGIITFKDSFNLVWRSQPPGRFAFSHPTFYFIPNSLLKTFPHDFSLKLETIFKNEATQTSIIKGRRG